MKGTWIISCGLCNQEYSWQVATYADAETFESLAEAARKGDKIRLDDKDRYEIGSNPMHGDKDCELCGSKAKNGDRLTKDLFSEVSNGK